jgi:hypothetical protein
LITSSDFRDKHLSALLVGYDWKRSEHFAQITLRGHDDLEQTYLIQGLTAWAVAEDFSAQHIEQCTLLSQPDGVYLCLDPYREGERSQQDNFWFSGASLAATGANNSFKPKPLRGSA